MAPPSITSRIRGSLLGVAITDALGGPAEFKARGSFPFITDFIRNDNFGLAPGTWTDDTSQTLCLAQSLIDDEGVLNPQTAIRKYIRWYRFGYLSATDTCFDIGIGTEQALSIWDEYFSENTQISRDDLKGHEAGQAAVDRLLKREGACGNGALMRVSPIGLMFYHNRSLALHNAALSSLASHPYPTNGECCQAYTGLIISALHGASKECMASEFAAFPWTFGESKTRFSGYKTLAAWEKQKEKFISSSGFVVDTLEAALWGFFTTDDFRAGAMTVVNLGNDADTVGAVYGGLAGSFYGEDAIPLDWREELVRRQIVERIATDLTKLAEKVEKA